MRDESRRYNGLMRSAIATLSAGAQPQSRLIEELRIGGDSSDERSIFTDMTSCPPGGGMNMFTPRRPRSYAGSRSMRDTIRRSDSHRTRTGTDTSRAPAPVVTSIRRLPDAAGTSSKS